MCVRVCTHANVCVYFNFWMWTIWSLLNFTILLLFYFLFIFFYYKTCRILAPLAGIELAPPALEGEVLTPGKSPYVFF